MPQFLCWVMALLAISAPIAATSPEGEIVEDADLCAVLARPFAYDHKLIRVTASVARDFETFWIESPKCPDAKPVWIEYGGPRPAEVAQWHDGPEDPAKNDPLIVEGIVTSLVDDAKLRKFDSFTKSLKRGKRARATLVGWIVSEGIDTDEAGNEEEFGFGPYGMYSLFVIQRVESVSSRSHRGNYSY